MYLMVLQPLGKFVHLWPALILQTPQHRAFARALYDYHTVAFPKLPDHPQPFDPANPVNLAK
jgi:hypothetical protein